ncbi:hypothetical protein B0T22DRAFT_463003 [Podospora appendiculata]|uniref:Uncharacterized protein n=1 Tax=Podospora appendiculata TaxID=314037 RepID=A0AAE0XCK2_9PEZI|nr:hypothetical protein B0T22DRAFT_463003 [Podospora appendiculata]
MFGERVAERTAATGHMYVNHNYPASDKNPRDAASIFARYMNLLERVVARSEGSPVFPTEPAATGPVGETKPSPRRQGDLESQNGYAMESLAANGHAQGGVVDSGDRGGAANDSDSPEQPSDRVFKNTVALLTRTYRAAVKARKIKAEEVKPWLMIPPDTTATLTPAELELVSQDLGAELARITAALRDDRKIPLEDAATIVRCILAAWADTVPRIDVMEHLPNREDPLRPESGTGVIFMDALPSVVALS